MTKIIEYRAATSQLKIIVMSNITEVELSQSWLQVVSSRGFDSWKNKLKTTYLWPCKNILHVFAGRNKEFSIGEDDFCYHRDTWSWPMTKIHVKMHGINYCKKNIWSNEFLSRKGRSGEYSFPSTLKGVYPA